MTNAIALEAGSVAHAWNVRQIWRADGVVITEDVICAHGCGPFPDYLDLVNVLEVDEEYALIEFSRYSQSTQMWVELSTLVNPDHFQPVENWQGTPEFVLCDEASGCYRIRIDESGQFKWSRIEQFKTDFVPFVPVISCPGRCRFSGQVERFQKLLRFELGDSYEFFEIRQDGRICWADRLRFSDICVPIAEAWME